MPSIWFNAIYKIKTLTCIQVQGSDQTVRIPAGILCLFAKTPWLMSFSALLLFYNFKRLRKIFDLVLLWVPNMTDFIYVLELSLKQAYIFLLQLIMWPNHTCLMLLNLMWNFNIQDDITIGHCYTIIDYVIIMLLVAKCYKGKKLGILRKYLTKKSFFTKELKTLSYKVVQYLSPIHSLNKTKRSKIAFF